MRRSIFMAAAAAVLCLVSCGGPKTVQTSSYEDVRSISAGENTRVSTIYGTYEGYLDGSIYTFKGIKYAKAERFMPPQDPDSFDGVRMAKIYGPQAPQDETLVWKNDTQRDYSFGNNFVIEPMDEKDLFVLNVWTPGINDGKKRPVFIWLHGGGFNGGSAHDLPCYEGWSLAKKGDIVVVSLNHRLNVLGYLDLTALGGKYSESVNLGMQDIVKAFEWVHQNIEKFGGDPNQVTIAGQSGGGRKVSTLTAMPSAKGLFQRAIVQSGSALTFYDTKVSQRIGLLTLENLGISPSNPDKLAQVPYDDLVAAGAKAIAQARNEFGADTPGLRFGYCPSVGNKYLPQGMFEPVASPVGKDVTMMIGCNFNELHFDVTNDLTRDEVIARLEARMGKEKAAAFVSGFEKTYPDNDPNDMLYVDTSYRPDAIAQATAKSKLGGAKAYLYFFTWRPEGNTLAASHGMELPFMFNNVSLEREMTGATPRAYRFQEKVSDAWLSFIKTGVPAAAGMPEWKPFNAEECPTMILDDECRLVNNFDKAFLEALKK